MTADAPTLATIEPKPPAADRPAGAKDYELGLLFVHGMGEQERGDTITQMGDALAEWLRKQLANRGDETAATETDFRIREASLRGGESSGLAHASVEVSGTSDGVKTTQSWLLAESWWADAFRPATFSELVAWAIAVGPWLIASQEAGLRQRLSLADAFGKQPFWRRVADRVVAGILVIIAALVAAIITPLALGLLVLSLVPVPVVSDFIRRLVQNLSGSFGDLLVLVRSPVRFAAMAERVRDDIDELHERAERVMVVAHSQGSAVAWHAIRRAAQVPAADRARVDLFLSFGQAFRKLKSLHRLHTRVRPLDQFWFAALATLSTLTLVTAALQLWTVLVTLVESEGRIGGLWDRAAFNVAGAAVCFGVVAVIQRILRLEAEKNDKAAEVTVIEDLAEVRAAFPAFRWLDLWASADPAPNGPLFTRPVDGVLSLRIRNLASTALDHSVYWSNVTEFVSAVAFAGASLLGWSPIGTSALPPSLRVASEIREIRVSILALARVAVFAALIAALWAVRDLLPDIGGAVLGFVDSLPQLPDWFEGWEPGWRGGVAAAALVGVAAVSWWILAGTWHAVIRVDEEAFFADGEQPVWHRWAVAWGVAALVLPTATVLWLTFNVRPAAGFVYGLLGLFGVLVVVVLLRGHEPRLSDPQPGPADRPSSRGRASHAAGATEAGDRQT